MSESQRALIVEDDPALSRLVQMHLGDIGCEADIAADGRAALEMFESNRYQLVVLDVMLPRVDGLSVLKSIRALPGYVPVLMLTAKSAEEDRVRGLEWGADDYLTKPFGVAELLARIRALFRRVEAMSVARGAPAREREVVEHQGLRIDVAKRRVTINERQLSLTAKEFDLLAHFARHPGQVFNRVQLLDQVWGYHHESYEHTVNSHINRLRGKVERNPAKPEYILTVWGIGYKFRDA